MTQTKNTLWGVFTRDGKIQYFGGRPLTGPQIRTTGGA